jgi:prepilin-type N-terminal cleavage/methylation domain-containing protein
MARKLLQAHVPEKARPALDAGWEPVFRKGHAPTKKAGRDGFTLIEVLAAFAIGSVIIVATVGLIRGVALHFDRGTRGVNEAERLALAVERLAADFGSARFVSRLATAGSAVAFTAEPAGGEKPARITFVGAAGVASGPPGEEVVVLTVEEDGKLMRLVRRRAAWLGPRMRFEDVAPGDPVVLLEGRFDIALFFARVTPEGALTWHSSWVGERTLPRFVRLVLRDRVTGDDLLGEADFVVRANAPAACGRPSAAVGCLAAAPAQAAAASPAEAIR